MIEKMKKRLNYYLNPEKLKWMCRGAYMIFYILAAGFFFIGYKNDSYNTIFVGIVCLWSGNMMFALEKLKERIIFFFFLLAIAFFMITKPFLRLLAGDTNYMYRFLPHNMHFALNSIVLTLWALLAGVLLYGIIRRIIVAISKKWKHSKEVKESKWRISKDEWVKNLGLMAEVTYYISFACYFAMRMEEYLFVRGGTYLDYYTSFVSEMPYIIYVISSFMKYALVIFLATLPSKRRSFLPLVLFIVSAVPSLLIGVRNPIAQNIIFVFLYYFIRDVLKDKKKWIGKIEKGIVIVMIPTVMIFFAAYSYIRHHVAVEGDGILGLLGNFLEGQGVTFEVLNIGHGCIPALPQGEFRNYTFGGFIDYFTHGTIAQKFFGATALPGGNNLTMALESNSFAHNMSYIAKGKWYLQGQGLGSSYLLELFTDYGYIGIVVFSIILGAFMVFMMKKMGRGIWSTSFFLLCLMSLFFVPRASALGWIEFILTAQCWVSIIGICCGAYMLARLRQYLAKRKIKSKE